MGFRPDDERIRGALEIVEREGLNYHFEKTTLGDDIHPNTVRFTLERGDRHARMTGASLGAGLASVDNLRRRYARGFQWGKWATGTSVEKLRLIPGARECIL